MCSPDASLCSQAPASVRKRPQASVSAREWIVRPCRWGKRVTHRLDDLKRVMGVVVLQLEVSFRCAGAVFWKVACSRCRASGICDPGVVVLRRPAWQARDSVCAGAFFVGPVVQSARFHDCVS